ncbi:hypothetical protein [Algisphaera agarilytica]|uniref:Putative Zn-ribbon and HTH transcriptional regulator n=1 Tax=Algisphaera agarilytica TaxID=1385975 RepID=A0A7X0H6V1_9BACT|nr:hypothetical protein [Algisphaera agarilytica]MBB6430370.1 putative Zn-ribbon and HTH transcriptional regulator [Algisphaera agarilytica]
MREDEDIYELSEEDALDDTPSASGEYELGEVSDNPPRGDLEIIMHPARYCRACGFDLTLVEVSPCPGCEKEFDPNDDSTTRDTPLPTQDNFFLQKPRVAGYGLLAWFILGRPIIHFVGDSLGGRFADVVLAFGILALTPWILIGVVLALETIEEHHNPKLVVTLPLGAAFGILLTVGLHPAIILIGAIVGAFAGFIRTWREA